MKNNINKQIEFYSNIDKNILLNLYILDYPHPNYEFLQNIVSYFLSRKVNKQYNKIQNYIGFLKSIKKNK